MEPEGLDRFYRHTYLDFMGKHPTHALAGISAGTLLT